MSVNSDGELSKESIEEPPPKKKKCDEFMHFISTSTDCTVFGRASGGAEKALRIGGLHMMDNLQLVDEVDAQEDEGSNSENDDSLYDSDEVPEEEIDALLEEGLPEEMKGPRSQRKKVNETPGEEPAGKEQEQEKRSKDTPYEKREKVMLVEKDTNPFEVLPEGWVQVIHNSGMPVYLHKESRVCTFSRPYFLGPGSVRKHSIPISAIPCLKYLKDIELEIEEKEKKEKEENEGTTEEENGETKTPQEPNDSEVEKKPEEIYTLPPGPLAKALVAQSVILTQKERPEVTNDPDVNMAIANTRVESVQEAQEHHSLEPEELREYCTKRFEFKTVKILRFQTWGDKRRYEKSVRWRNRPQLPKGTKLISLKRHHGNDSTQMTTKKDWVFNPKDKSYVCILHEYVQHALKNQPKYKFTEVENASTPYSASITINDVLYSTGYGSSKKQAKMEAAKSALEILLPELGKKIRMEKNDKEETDLSFFDEIRVEDPRVPELCNKTSELSPYSILINCLQRNYGLSGANIECRLITRKNQKNEFVMSVGKHTVQVSCRNKKDGKQRASQAILQKLHRHITSWGSLLRLYGNRSLQTMKERKAEEQEVTLLQTNATLHQPNNSIINKLREEMLKLKYMKHNLTPIAKFFSPDNILPPTRPGTELNNVDLC